MTPVVPAAEGRPLVSIGVPIYNEEKHLAEVLDSLLAQDYENFEIVISDNASTDGTQRICEKYAAADRRVRYYRHDTHVHGFQNFNRLLELARGEFFMWVSGHDLHHRSQVSKCIEVMLEDAHIVLCYTQMIWIDEQSQPFVPLEKGNDYIDTRGLELSLLRINVVLWALRGGNPIHGLFRLEALKKTPGFTQIVSPDMALLIELAAIGKFAFVSEPLLYVRRGISVDNWRILLSRLFPDELRKGKTERLFWRMMYQLAKRVAGHVRSLPGKILAFCSVIIGMWVNFRWILNGLRDVKHASVIVEPDEPPEVVGNRADVRSAANGG